MIAIIDYGAGNIKSVMFALQRIGVESRLCPAGTELEAADGVILPGVGAFSSAMDELRSRAIAEMIPRIVRKGKPLLGICVGHQLLFSESEEYGLHSGFDLIPGAVRRFGPGTKVPHMGWNQVWQRKESRLFDGIEDGSFFYFAHSFYTLPADDAAELARTDYGLEFASGVEMDNVYGVQFHPEKSGDQGRRLLQNFCRLSEG